MNTLGRYRQRARGVLVLVAAMLALTLMATPSVAAGQRNAAVRRALFDVLEQRLAAAETADLELLSPKNYEEARKKYDAALEDYQRGRTLEQIERNIAESSAYLDAANASAATARQLLEEPLAMRGELFANGIPRDHRELRDADRKLVEAAREAEDGSIPNVRRKSDEAAREYRKATLKILEDEWWKQTRDQLRQRRDSVPQEQYRNAEASLKAIEEHLKSLDDEDPFSVGALLRDTRRDLDAVLAQVSTSPT